MKNLEPNPRFHCYKKWIANSFIYQIGIKNKEPKTFGKSSHCPPQPHTIPKISWITSTYPGTLIQLAHSTKAKLILAIDKQSQALIRDFVDLTN